MKMRKIENVGSNSVKKEARWDEALLVWLNVIDPPTFGGEGKNETKQFSRFLIDQNHPTSS